MRQVFIIHGGDSFNSYESYRRALEQKVVDYERLKYSPRWREWIATQLPEYDVLLPTMPNGSNASYDEWKVYFEKLLQYFGDDVQLVGHSLGAMFLAIYLNESTLPKKVRRVILVSPGYDDETHDELGSFKIPSAAGVGQNTEEVHLLHSKDDPVVPFSELAKFQVDLPTATVHVFSNRGHFLDSTFPELLALLKQK